jgi:hypothetical protein
MGQAALSEVVIHYAEGGDCLLQSRTSVFYSEPPGAKGNRVNIPDPAEG